MTGLSKVSARRTRMLLAATLLATTAPMLAPGGTRPAAAQAQVTYSVPAGPLGRALAVYGRQAGLQVTYLAAIAAGKTTAGMSGPATQEQALARILQGSGLTYSFTNAGTVAIRRADGSANAQMVDGAIPLDPINVDGQGTATGPVPGYVARRSLTATKSDIPLLETPQAISVIGRQQMREQGAQTIVEALRYNAGVSVNINPNDTRFESLRIRGFEPVLYLDGMQLPFGASLFGRPKVDPFMLERVEVLRGPSSALYGQIAPGGLVNMVSLRPQAAEARMVELQFNNFGRAQAAFDATGRLDPKGEFLYRLTGLVHGGGTQIDFVDDFRGVINPSLTWRPSLDTTWTFLGSYQRDETGVAIQFLPARGTLLPNPNGVVPVSKFVGEPGWDKFVRTQYWAGYQFEHRFTDVWTVRQNLRYAVVDTNLKAVIGQGGLAADLRTLNRFAFIVPESATAFTVDNQAEARFATGALSHIALFGIDYRRASSEFAQYFGGAPSIDLFNTVYGKSVTTPPLTSRTGQVQDQVGIYVQDQIALDRWRLTLSGRHDWAAMETLNYIARTTVKQDDAAFSWRAGLNYVFDFGLSPYVAFAHSFLAAPGVTRLGTPFVPTTGDQIEGGIKYQPTGTNILLTAAVFEITQQNVLTTDPSGPPGSQVQTGEVRSRGVELEANASLKEGLDLVASYTYTDTEVLKSNTPAQLGKHLITVPMHQAALWVNYTFQEGPMRGLGLGAGVRYTGVSYGDAANTLEIPAYTLFDAAIQYDLANLSPTLRGAKAALNVQNIFDEDYVSTCQSLSACFYGSGRVVTGSLRYTW